MPAPDPFRSFCPPYAAWATEEEADIKMAALRTTRIEDTPLTGNPLRNRESSCTVLTQGARAVAVASVSLGSSSYHTKSPTISRTSLPTTKGNSGLLEPNSHRS